MRYARPAWRGREGPDGRVAWKHRPACAPEGVIPGGWGGCSGSGTAPGAGEPTLTFSPVHKAASGPNRGHFMSQNARMSQPDARIMGAAA